MKQYLEIASKILDGTIKEPAREGMPPTRSIHGVSFKHDLTDGFPLLTTKKMSLYNIFYELIWFLNGNTNIKYLVDKKVNIWNEDAYKHYLKFSNNLKEPDYEYLMDDPNENKIRAFTFEEFIKNIKDGLLGSRSDYKLGDLGKVYGYQWRHPNFDQVLYVINNIQNYPNSRYHIIDGWNPAELSEMALPPCHLLYQFFVRGNKLDLIMYQRSCDYFLGVPYNIASMSLLLTLFAKLLNYQVGEITWFGGDVHLYDDHINAIKEQLTREPYSLPTIQINKDLKTLDDILSLKFSDITINNYQSHDKIFGKLSVGK